MKKYLLALMFSLQTAVYATPFIPIDAMLEDEDKALIAKTRAENRFQGNAQQSGSTSGSKSNSKGNCSQEIGNVSGDGRAGKLQPREVKIIVLGSVVNTSDCKK
jgi:hypothetical protein